eukprot:427611_1
MSFKLNDFNYLPQCQRDLVAGYCRYVYRKYHIAIPTSIITICTVYFHFNKDFLHEFIKIDKPYFHDTSTAATGCNDQYTTSCFKFPSPTDININMMPFIMSHNFNESKLPPYLKTYFINFIKTIAKYDHTQIDKICYLTIQESWVDRNTTQRISRIHTETQDSVHIRGYGRHKEYYFDDIRGYNWTEHELRGGVYIASNIHNSCAVWPCKIISNHNLEIIGSLGDIEYLKRDLPNKVLLKGNHLYWITDRTPHQSLILAYDKKVYRQFFRLVTHKVSRWYEKHCTKNPNGVVPNVNITYIVKENKLMEYNTNKVNDIYLKYMEKHAFPPKPDQLRLFAKYRYNKILKWAECRQFIQKYQTTQDKE